ncbi:hypothetical protein EYF80_053225 [Liparis tanakae]|uniref:EF-hand domain-containing protein n=1 Tax=Liparis tanakae TaxID=230148 RepID=A0A4Z2F753_9TELE|nr:hypothetical protein EYF80_053225 [Liparis tanakae]
MLRVQEAVRSSGNAVRRQFVTRDPERTGKVTGHDLRKLSCFLDAGATGRMSYHDFLGAVLP